MPDPKKYYGENGEDRVLWSLFHGCRGFFVDVGAFDGQHWNNSLSFEEQGWAGICIEAHPVFARRCARNRKASLCLHAACVQDPGINRVEFLAEPLGVMSGVCPDEGGDFEGYYAARGMKFPGFARVNVPARTLDRILDEFLPPETAIDFLSVDVQGTELDVLRGIDFARYPVRAIVVAARTLTATQDTKAHLDEQRYFFARALGADLFFARDRNDAQILSDGGVRRVRESKREHRFAAITTTEENPERTERAVPAPQGNRLSENVARQAPGQPLSEVLGPAIERCVVEGRAPGRYRFGHIVHTYASPAGSTGDRTQGYTFAALERAARFVGEKARVELISVHLAQDGDFPPRLFAKAPELTRTVLDIGDFRVPRRLPLLFDILEKGLAAAREAEFIVFTNADICLMPHFYEFVSTILDLGFDTLVINRRLTGTFPADTRWGALLESDYGGPHPGFDCFVFPTRFGARMVRSDACVGAGHVMRSLLYNLVALSENMLILTDVHATYHIGSDSDALRPEHDDYVQFNQDNAKDVLNALIENPIARRRLRDFCRNHGEFVIPEEEPGKVISPAGDAKLSR
jgi:FkbM family methyltransferase